MNYLLDTTTLSDILAEHSNTVARVDALAEPQDSVAASLISYGEVWFGLRIMASGRRRREREQRATVLFEWLSLVPVTRSVADAYVSSKADLHRQGTPIPEADVWIAATARAANYTLVSRDSHSAQIPGLKLVDWSKP